nr:hypothetical protein [Candidatus Arsenophonus triatominarum]
MGLGNHAEENRIVNHNKQLNKLDISEEGTPIHLRGYGWVTVFKFIAKNGRIDYRVTNKDNPTRQYVKSIARRLNFDYKVCYELYN